MGALTDKLCDFLDAHTAGVLATASPEGKPRQSLVYFARDGDRRLISTLTDRLKARDVRRTRGAGGLGQDQMENLAYEMAVHDMTGFAHLTSIVPELYAMFGTTTAA